MLAFAGNVIVEEGPWQILGGLPAYAQVPPTRTNSTSPTWPWPDAKVMRAVTNSSAP
jgi:hypothetical protein